MENIDNVITTDTIEEMPITPKKEVDNTVLINLMKMNYSYPETNDPHFQYKIYKKREFYINKIQSQKPIIEYQDIKTYRDKECGDKKFGFQSQQSLISNFINPDTPYKGLLIFHGVGTGKTCGAYAITENFKNILNNKHFEKIYILVSGPLIREQWKTDLIEMCARDTYLKNYNQNVEFIDEIEKAKAIKQAKLIASQYYKIMSYRSFQKKVLGQKILLNKKTDNADTSNIKIKKTYRKTITGDLERDQSVDKLESLSNTLIIVDEAHNLTDNEYGESLNMLIRNPNSKNLRVLLLTATPMKNLATDIIELINLLRPEDSQIEKDNVFTGTGHLIEFKPEGATYLKNMLNGYVSHFRGVNPLTFAEEIDEGETPPGLIFTKVVRCKMNKFQLDTYTKTVDMADDTLDRKSQSVSNFVFPGLDNVDKTKLEGYSGEDGINIIRNQLKTNKTLLINNINSVFFDNKFGSVEQSTSDKPSELLMDNEKLKTLTGKLFKMPYLELFSIKFATCLKNLNQLVIGKKGPGIAFIYSNLVKIGIELFKETLLQNGYLEFSENNSSNYNITDDTLDSLTGLTRLEYINSGKDINDFHPATFITFTGKIDETIDDLPETRMLILKNHFNNINNKDGKFIKFILGSRVMNEGITLHNVKEVHILDVYYHYGRMHQVIGRAIRRCVHYKITDENNKFPKVNVYKYVASILDENDKTLLSSEEKLYQKAENKYIMVKQIERLMKETAIDCPLNYHGNIFQNEVEKYKDCLIPSEYMKLTENEKKNNILCPSLCDFQKCNYKCFDEKLNMIYYDEINNTYKNIKKDDLDYSTFTHTLKRNEIMFIKEKIKELYKFKYVYTFDELKENILRLYKTDILDLFDDYFLYYALEELIPIDENDFNNFKDIIYDKFNVAGYIIYRGQYYIFQPLNQNEDVPMWYRSNFHSITQPDLTVYNFIKNTGVVSTTQTTSTINQLSTAYIFNLDYYNSKNEFIYVGIIDKGSSRLKSIIDNKQDIFKLRPNRNKILEKKRGTGIPTLKGAVCNTSKDKSLLFTIAKQIGIQNIDNYKNDTRLSICDLIKFRLLFLEKFSTSKSNNKLLFMIVPSNHPVYPFPFNLEDRVQYVIKELQNDISITLTYKITDIKHGKFENETNKEYSRYNITLTNTESELNEFKLLLLKHNFIFDKNKWSIIIE